MTEVNRSRTFIQTREFSRKWDELGLNDDDLNKLENDLLENFDHYPVIKGTGGLRKARIPVGDKGKSGGARVCFVDFVFAETVYLITVYGKAEKDNLSKSERNDIKKAIETLKSSLGGGNNE
ncbi:MAG: type II toxin-antitoxin system RelE/ParE family toxin [Lachnospiraceae bacterium]|nr:type II toxin-antitoxin system RelE/ParE family toxin [Lachnospiraceae bacterium]